MCACDIAIVDNESNLYLQVSCFKHYLLDPIGHESWSLESLKSSNISTSNVPITFPAPS